MGEGGELLWEAWQDWSSNNCGEPILENRCPRPIQYGIGIPTKEAKDHPTGQQRAGLHRRDCKTTQHQKYWGWKPDCSESRCPRTQWRRRWRRSYRAASNPRLFEGKRWSQCGRQHSLQLPERNPSCRRQKINSSWKYCPQQQGWNVKAMKNQMIKTYKSQSILLALTGIIIIYHHESEGALWLDFIWNTLTHLDSDNMSQFEIIMNYQKCESNSQSLSFIFIDTQLFQRHIWQGLSTFICRELPASWELSTVENFSFSNTCITNICTLSITSCRDISFGSTNMSNARYCAADSIF